METELCSDAPTDWDVKSIGEVCVRVTSGGTPSRRDSSYYVGGTWPWVKTQELQDKWIDDTEEHITEDAVSASSAKVLPVNTVLVAMYGATVGQLGLLRRPMTCNQACSALVADPKTADYRFVFYQLLQARPQLKGLATGAAQQNLSGVLIKSLRFPYPSVREQRAIAHILGTLDDKIELNRRMSETLEAMARALFKSWFIDFDPVRRNAARTRNQPSPGLRPPSPIGRVTGGEGVIEGEAFDHLFPARLVNSELGEIPDGWKVGNLGDVVEQLREHVNPADASESAFAHFSLPAFDGGQRPTVELGRDIKSNKWRVPPGSVLLSKLNPEIERVWLVDVDTTDNAVGSTEFLVLMPRAPFARIYVYCLARSVPFRQQMESLVTGTSKSHQRAQPSAVMESPVVIPSRPVVEAFDRAVADWLSKVLVSRRESRTLATLRDTLLPKLISGELRVKDAERFAAGVT